MLRPSNDAPAVLVPRPCVNPIETGVVPDAADQAVPLNESVVLEFACAGASCPAAAIAAVRVPKPTPLLRTRVGGGTPLHTPPVIAVLFKTWEFAIVCGLMFPLFKEPPCKTALELVPIPVGKYKLPHVDVTLIDQAVPLKS